VGGRAAHGRAAPSPPPPTATPGAVAAPRRGTAR
jgi:hypothetical protein